MFNTPCQERRHQRRPFWNTLVAIVALVSVLGFFSVHAGPAHAAAATPPPPFPSVDQFGYPAAQTPAEKAYTADKVQLSDEYVQRVLSGQETLADFETHYRAFMVKWHLGNVANLHTVLTRSAARLRSTAGRLTMPASPTVAAQTPVGAAQFPEESWNWCGPATLSTTVVENSFVWSGANTYNGFTVSYNPYVVTQPSNLATNDEYWLASNGVISGDIYNNGTSVGQMNTMLNNFTNGHGGNYVQDWFPTSEPMSSQIADFQNKVSSDIGTGWDVPTGIVIGAGSFYSMPGYPYNHGEIDHWVPVTWISSDHNTTYYSDPVYAAPAYSGWAVPAPYEHTSTSNIVWYTTVILW